MITENKFCSCGQLIIIHHMQFLLLGREALRYCVEDTPEGACLLKCPKCQKSIIYSELKT